MTAPDMLVLTSEIVAAHVANNDVADEVPALVRTVYDALSAVTEEPELAPRRSYGPSARYRPANRSPIPTSSFP